MMLDVKIPTNGKDALEGAPPTIRTEGDLMRNLKLVGKSLGYKVFHNAMSQLSDRGYPDLHFLGNGLSLYIETKGPKWKISDEQQEWIDGLQFLYEPSDGVIVASFAWPRDYRQVCQLLEERYRTWNGL